MSVDVQGHVAPGFEPVAEAFARNFDEGLEVGAAFAVYREGEALVDIWAGVADRTTGRPWQRDTAQTIFSGTKGLTGTVMLMLLDRGVIALDDPVQKFWPEFGKPNVRIRDIVAHLARLPGVATAEISPAQFFDDEYMEAVMAREPQSSDPRAALTYHGATIGWLCGGVIRRVTGKSMPQFLADEITTPLGLDIWVGLPEAIEPRVARLETNDTWTSGKVFQEPPAIGFKDDVLFWSIWRNPTHLTPATFSPVWNSRMARAGRAPAANGVADARSMARFYDALANGRFVSAEALQLAAQPLCDGWDGVLDGPRRNSVLFQLNPANPQLGPVANAFGHDGAGGSLHACWPDQRLGFSYCMNLLRADPEGERRTVKLTTALAACIGIA